MLEIRELEFIRGATFALTIDHWQVVPGEVRAVLGTNGAGKSTLLKLLCGEQRSRQQVLLHARALDDWNPVERARHLGVLPQASSLDFAFSAEEVVCLGLIPLTLGWRDARQAVAAIMRATDCAHLARKNYRTLSGGERQRVQLARILVQLSQAEREPVLLLDEPTSAQDLGQQHRVLDLARQLATERDYAVAAILHDLNLAIRYADQCILLSAGELVASGVPADVITRENIQRHWGYAATILTSAGGKPVIA
ncbi:MAG: heme ABC transporter ATP-binding protein [Halieaceae bacterium]|nr:heme ABC transporter ATP-binding protein [Halieaceae bacterium]MCP5167589.1 heme ABC transporter ATP-binding protein [Pseudomonadales bacterium]MCP5186148.1 heme ABC transporter ATP-binding protein [Pseudomonadales bacterium]